MLTLILLALSAPAAAEDFCADLPGLATGTCVVPKGVLQVETVPLGWSLDRSSGGRHDEVAFGNTELRFGVAPGIEVQASWTPLVHLYDRAPGAPPTTVDGAGDAMVGAKFRLTPADAPVAFALYPLVKLPTAREPIGNGEVEASLLAPVDLTLSPSWSLNIMPEADWLADDGGHGHHGGATLAAALTHDIYQRLSVEADLLHSEDFDPAGHSEATGAELAIIWLPRPRTQLDVALDRGLTGTFPDWRLSVGLATRL